MNVRESWPCFRQADSQNGPANLLQCNRVIVEELSRESPVSEKKERAKKKERKAGKREEKRRSEWTGWRRHSRRYSGTRFRPRSRADGLVSSVPRSSWHRRRRPAIPQAHPRVLVVALRHPPREASLTRPLGNKTRQSLRAAGFLALLSFNPSPKKRILARTTSASQKGMKSLHSRDDTLEKYSLRIELLLKRDSMESGTFGDRGWVERATGANETRLGREME